MTSLANIRNWIYRQKFYFESGFKFLPIVNFFLLLLAVSDKLKAFGIPRWGVYATIPVVFFGIWAFGKFVIDVAKGYAKDEIEALKRSPAWEAHKENFERIKEIHERITKN